MTDGLTRSGTGCFIAVPIWQQWASNGETLAEASRGYVSDSWAFLTHVLTACGLDQPVVDRRAPSPKFGDKKAICDPIPPNLFDDVTKPTSPMRIPSPDRADAPAIVFADDELCVERKPMKTHQRGSLTASPKQTVSAAEAAAARRLDKCRMTHGEPPKQRPLPGECKRFHTPHCRPEKIECAPLYDDFTQPPTETCEEYLTKPMRLPLIRNIDHVTNEDNAVFAI